MFAFDEPSADQKERAARREAIDRLIDDHVEDENVRESFRVKLDQLVAACLPEPRGGLSQEGGIEREMTADEAVRFADRWLDRRSLARQFAGVPNPSRYVR
jgi:hypothetical protein